MANLIITANALESPAQQTWAIPIESILYSKLDISPEGSILILNITSFPGGRMKDPARPAILFSNETNPPTLDYLRPALNKAFAAKPGSGDIELAEFLPDNFLDDLVVSVGIVR